MSKIENIYDNYIDKCPNCGGDLSHDDKLCPYCGFNLFKGNVAFEQGEAEVKDALNNVENATHDLEKNKVYAQNNSYKKSTSHMILKGLIGTCISAAITIGFMFLLMRILF